MTKPFLIDTQEIRVAVDLIVVGYKDNKLHTLFIQRKYAPDKDKWALPGGFIHNDEELVDAVDRVLLDETGMDKLDFKIEIGTFSSVIRDPRRRVISVAYLLLCNELFGVAGQTKDYQATVDAKWLDWDNIPKDLAFDHETILLRAKDYLEENIYTKPIAKWLLPDKFTFGELQELYEKLIGMELEKRNFRKTINSRNFLEGLDEKKKGVHRPAQLFKFKN